MQSTASVQKYDKMKPAHFKIGMTSAAYRVHASSVLGFSKRMRRISLLTYDKEQKTV